MVQTDISQLSRECNQWRESLRSYREEFNQLKHNLQHAAKKSLSKEQLTDLEHFQNQLHIQLINIHDLKQAVKAHEKKVNFEVAANGGQTSEEHYANHETLYEDYQLLEQTLNDLRTDFNNFISNLQ